jgi:hypothetical protein
MVEIPATQVNRVPLRDFPEVALVPACTGTGTINGNTLIVNLHAEPVDFDLASMSIDAEKVAADLVLTLADGSAGTGSATFPMCPISIGSAAPITATGSVVLKPGPPDSPVREGSLTW